MLQEPCSLYPKMLMPVTVRDLTVRWKEDDYGEGDEVVLISEDRKHRIVVNL